MNYRSILIATLQTVALYMLGVIPLAGQIVALFTPVPLIILSLRQGRRTGLIALLAASMIAGLIAGWEVAIFLIFSFGLMATGTAEGMHRKMKPEQTALLGGLLPIAMVGAVTAFYLIKVQKNPFIEVDAYFREAVAEAIKVYTKMGLKEMASLLSSIPDTFIYYFSRLLPAFLISTSVMQAAACFGISRALIEKKQGPEPGRVSLSLWHAPDVWVWGLIASLALIMAPQEPARLAGWNLAILFGMVYLIQGAAIVDHYLRKVHIKAFGRGLVLVLVLIMPPTIACVIALGVVDVWADLRKVRGPVLKA